MKWFLVIIHLLEYSDGETFSSSTIIEPPSNIEYDTTTMTGCFKFREYVFQHMMDLSTEGQNVICIKK